MSDMNAVITPKSDQINADSLLSGPLTIEITAVDIRPGTEQPIAISFAGDDGKPWKCCKSMARVLVAAWGANSADYVGRRATLYCDPTVKWGGMAVGGIRVSHLSHIERDMVLALTATKGQKKAHTVKPLADVETKPDPRIGAEKWANDHIGDIKTTTDLDEFAAVKSAGAKAMAKLAQSFPDLHNLVLSAYHAQSDSFREGKPDEDTGEGFNDDSAFDAAMEPDKITDELIKENQNA